MKSFTLLPTTYEMMVQLLCCCCYFWNDWRTQKLFFSIFSIFICNLSHLIFIGLYSTAQFFDLIFEFPIYWEKAKKNEIVPKFLSYCFNVCVENHSRIFCMQEKMRQFKLFVFSLLFLCFYFAETRQSGLLW